MVRSLKPQPKKRISKAQPTSPQHTSCYPNGSTVDPSLPSPREAFRPSPTPASRTYWPTKPHITTFTTFQRCGSPSTSKTRSWTPSRMPTERARIASTSVTSSVDTRTRGINPNCASTLRRARPTTCRPATRIYWKSCAFWTLRLRLKSHSISWMCIRRGARDSNSPIQGTGTGGTFMMTLLHIPLSESIKYWLASGRECI